MHPNEFEGNIIIEVWKYPPVTAIGTKAGWSRDFVPVSTCCYFVNEATFFVSVAKIKNMVIIRFFCTFAKL